MLDFFSSAIVKNNTKMESELKGASKLLPSCQIYVFRSILNQLLIFMWCFSNLFNIQYDLHTHILFQLFTLKSVCVR